MKKSLLFLLLFVSLTIQAQTTYYVSTGGNDATGTGTLANPWKTLLKATTSVTVSGSLIHIAAGTYLENTRCALSAGVSIEGEGTSTIITNTSLTSRINYGPSGSNGDAIINLVSPSVINGNQEIRNLKFDGASLTSSHSIYIMNRHNVKIHNCTFLNFNYCAVVWWASGTSDGVAPATRLSGSEFYSNTVTNCAGYNSADASFYGALYCGGHTGMLIHDNVMIENGHSSGNQGWPIKFWLWGGMMLGCKIYDNYLEKTDFSVWDFVIESTGEDGMEIYNNTMIGGIDLNKQNYSGVYPWSVYIHDNQIGPSAEVSALSVSGITLEHNNSHVLIERNIIQNCSPAILFTPRTTAQSEIIIRYNIMKTIRNSDYYTEGITMNPGGTGTTIDGFYIYNNVIEGTSGSTDYGIRLVHAGGGAISSANNVRIINNIFLNFNGYNGSYLYLTGASVYTNLYVQNNLLFNNGNSNGVLFTGTPASYTNSGNIIGNPLFVGGSPYSYQLQSGSPGKDTGLDIGLTSDFQNFVVPFNTVPDIGAYEFGAIGIPGYLSSSVEDAAPSVLAVTYNLTLANVVPDATAFAVMVNSVARTVSTVAISASKVLLTLASPVVNGDVVTVAYTKPVLNPLQTASGGQAETYSSKTVTNNVSAVIPAYVSSVVENASPTLLTMTYSITLTGTAPAPSAFAVVVNSVSRTVNSVLIVAGKVQLTLASAVVFGDVVTVAYTKPVLNPLQTSSGSQAVTLSATGVTNNLNSTIPAYVSSVVEDATPTLLTMTYSLTLTGTAPAPSAFAVLVNSAARTVNSLIITAGKVQLTLASAVAYGDLITVAYTKPVLNPLQTASGLQAASLNAASVTNNVSPVTPVYVSSVIENTTPALLEMTYQPALANINPGNLAFSVKVNTVSRAVNSVSISSTKVQLTLAIAVVYGDVVTVAYTKPVANPLQTSSGVQAASLTATSVTNNVTPPIPAYVSSVIENSTPALLEMTYQLSLANINPGNSAFSVKVNTVTRSVNSVSISGTKVQLTLASAVAYGDVVTVAYTKPVVNPLQTSSGGQAATLSASSVTNNVSPAIPVYVSSVIENSTPALLEMTYQLSLANINPGNSAFSVKVNSLTKIVNSVSISGTKVQLTLAGAVAYGDVVTVAYTKPVVNPLQTSSGGQAASLSARSVNNNVSPVNPVYITSAIENATPAIMSISFSEALAGILPNLSAFTVLVNSIPQTVNSVAVSGAIVTLTLAKAVLNGDAVTIAYTKPGSNPLQTSSGGQVATFSAQTVNNNVGVVNSAPVIVVHYPDTCRSGFVGEIDASESTDFNNDILLFSWIPPAGVDVSSSALSKIQFLAPVVNSIKTISFTLNVGDGKSNVTKNISIIILPYKPELALASISSVTTDSYIGNNIAERIIDDDFGTYWNADGDNQWVTCRFLDQFIIDHLKISFPVEEMGGSVFDILASEDGLVWDPLLANATSCGFSDNLQIFIPEGSEVKAYTFIKLVGHGNSLNSMNKISELQVFGVAVNANSDLIDVGMTVYPNPANEVLNIFFKRYLRELQMIRITNISGKIEYEKLSEDGFSSLQIPVTFARGFYIIQLISKGRVRGASKLVIQ